MKIAFFVPSFPVLSETFILRQITGLIGLGHEVDIYAERRPEPGPIHPEITQFDLCQRTVYTDEMPEASGVWEMPIYPLTGETWLPGSERAIPNVRRLLQAAPAFLRCLSSSPRLTLQVLDRRRYGYRAESLSSLYRLAALCARPKTYDVLHAHFGSQGNTFLFARDLWKAPFVVSFHGYDFSQAPNLHGKRIYERLFHVADCVTVNSEYARTRVEELGCPSAKIRALHYGLDLDSFAFHERRLGTEGPIRVVTVGRLVEKKGIEYAIRAVAKVRGPCSREISYEIIGDGPLRQHLDGLVRQLGVQSIVSLSGARDGEYVGRALSNAHLFMLTSVTSSDGDQEGTPVSLMEAQAAGLPVISSWHSGIPEVVLDGQSGFLAAERDVAFIADRLLYLVNHPETWAEMGKAGREHMARNYDIRKLNVELESLYRELI